MCPIPNAEGRFVLTLNADRRLRVWDLIMKKCVGAKDLPREASPSAVALGADPDTALAAAGAGHLLRCLVPSYGTGTDLFSGNVTDQEQGLVKFFAVVSVAETGGDARGRRLPAAVCGGFCELRYDAIGPSEVVLFDDGKPVIKLEPPELWADMRASAEELKDVQLDGKVGWVRLNLSKI